MAIKWNRVFTELLHGSRPTLWGNWALNPHIQPGAVGIVDSASGEFTLVAETMPQVKLATIAQSRKWKISSSDVKRQETQGTLKGTVTDPNTGAQVNPEIAVEWTFGSEESITSEFSIESEKRLSDLSLILEQYEWLHAQAKSVNMADDIGIAEGFGVVTSVIYASSGVNVGAKQKNATFSLASTISGMNALLGESGPSGKGGISFISSGESSSIESHTLPAQQGEVATQALPLAYSFTSFAGSNLLIPNWVKKIGALKLLVDSKASKLTTYVSKALVTYKTPQGVETLDATISAGASASFDIPMNASELKLEVEFINIGQNTKMSRQWLSPLSQWVGGTRTVNLAGTWPGAPSLTVVEED